MSTGPCVLVMPISAYLAQLPRKTWREFGIKNHEVHGWDKQWSSAIGHWEEWWLVIRFSEHWWSEIGHCKKWWSVIGYWEKYWSVIGHRERQWSGIGNTPFSTVSIHKHVWRRPMQCLTQKQRLFFYLFLSWNKNHKRLSRQMIHKFAQKKAQTLKKNK